MGRGFSLWHLLEDWLTADSMESLYGAILTSLERGFVATPESTEAARNMAVSAGSLSALKTLYPWHPSFQKMDEQGSTEMLAIDFQYDGSGGRVSTGQKPSRHGSVSGGGMGMTSAGGQQWLIASQQAEAKLEGARVDTQRGMDAMVKRAQRLAEEENIKYVDAFLRIQQDVLDSQMEDDDDSATQDDDESSMRSGSVSALDQNDDKGEDTGRYSLAALEEDEEAEDARTASAGIADETFLTSAVDEDNGEAVVSDGASSPLRTLCKSIVDDAMSRAIRKMSVGEQSKGKRDFPLEAISNLPQKKSHGSRFASVSGVSATDIHMPNFNFLFSHVNHVKLITNLESKFLSAEKLSFPSLTQLRMSTLRAIMPLIQAPGSLKQMQLVASNGLFSQWKILKRSLSQATNPMPILTWGWTLCLLSCLEASMLRASCTSSEMRSLSSMSLDTGSRSRSFGPCYPPFLNLEVGGMLQPRRARFHSLMK